MKLKDTYRLKINSLIKQEIEQTCGPQAIKRYNFYHNRRFGIIINYCRKYVNNKKIKVLDIGRSQLTGLLANEYEDVYSIGFDPQIDKGGHRLIKESEKIKHITFDLNLSYKVEQWPNYPNYFDLIVFSETIEHLHTTPVFSLLLFHYLLKHNGILIITTPNATSFFKRYKMLNGVNPFEQIRYYEGNPGHFREYTKKELLQMIDICNFESLECSYISFSGRKLQKPFDILPSLRESIIAVTLKK